MPSGSRDPGELIRIRPFLSSDRDFMLSLAPRLVIGIAPWRDPGKMLAAMQGFINESITAIGNDAVVLIAEDMHGIPLGFLSITHNTNFTGETQAYIGEIAVSAEAEGRGIGRALMHAGEEWARTHGYSLIVLDTGAANARARAIYRRLGYAEESVRLVKELSHHGA